MAIRVSMLNTAYDGSRIERVLTVVYNTQNYWDCRLCPSSDILNNYETQRLGNCYLFPPSGEGEGDMLCWVPKKDVTPQSLP
jgi:hypothetical protein